MARARPGHPRPQGPARSAPRNPRRYQGQPEQPKQPKRGKQPSTPQPDRSRKENKKVNSKPKNLDDQEIPFRLREIMKSRQEMKKHISKKKRKAVQVAFRQKFEKEAMGSLSDIPIPKFKQGKKESDKAYVHRMEQEAQHVIFLSENQVERKPEKEEAPQQKKEKSQRKKEFQRRRLDKVRHQKEEKAIASLEKELFQDSVKFGEVVLQPPELTAKPRKNTNSDKLGKKSLLLANLLAPSSALQPPAISLARQRIVAEERERVVRAYRDLKKHKQQQLEQRQASSPSEGKPKKPA
ncbi:coiled-coil domain-containing protein 137 isoform X2 [Antechinus flavipes]|uniref:coiled-coil domain-containing protein 137 isoform X2 n=1 Tax=Antechinus flavipes TaxID=38775 RepID=UPI0022367BD0|nr:coiled-coil domain-containing protein 137 isoform X2 [Antechinus flavipes]